MTDTKAFKAMLMLRGYTMGSLARALGMAECSLSYKANNVRQFKTSEIQAIKRLLDLTPEERDAIFFAE